MSLQGLIQFAGEPRDLYILDRVGRGRSYGRVAALGIWRLAASRFGCFAACFGAQFHRVTRTLRGIVAGRRRTLEVACSPVALTLQSEIILPQRGFRPSFLKCLSRKFFRKSVPEEDPFAPRASFSRRVRVRPDCARSLRLSRIVGYYCNSFSSACPASLSSSVASSFPSLSGSASLNRLSVSAR